jgi:putative glutamine amidotransferase
MTTERRPRVLVTCDRRDGGPPTPDAPRVRPRRAEALLNEVIVAHLRAAGATPLLVPPVHEGEPPDIDGLLAIADGVVITGGAHDLHPRHYGQPILARVGPIDEARAALELPLARACLDRGVPILGVCGGMQAMVVAMGGTLVQDLRTQRPEAGDHEQSSDPATPWHPVRAWGPLTGAVGPAVNSTHHQAIDALGPFEVCAEAPDGVIEGVHLPAHPFAVGVQWHPELVEGGVYARFVQAVAERMRAATVPPA